MFAINPFAALSPAVSPGVMQAYLVIMIILVAAGTLFDIVHKGSAKYFFNNFRKSKGKPVGGGELVAIAVKTAVVDVLASGEFCNAKRRIAHLLTMYGFVLHVVSTAVMVFDHLSAESHVAAPVVDRRPDGAGRRLLVLVLHPRRRGGRRQLAVPRDARRPFHPLAACERDARPDLGLAAGGRGMVLFALYILATTVLFGSACRGPSSRTCSSSPPRRSRSGCPRPTARRESADADP